MQLHRDAFVLFYFSAEEDSLHGSGWSHNPQRNLHSPPPQKKKKNKAAPAHTLPPWETGPFSGVASLTNPRSAPAVIFAQVLEANVFSDDFSAFA